jgi:hypothetical protein
LTRSELAEAIERAGIAARGQRLDMSSTGQRLKASSVAALRSKQHTYALLDERAPEATPTRRGVGGAGQAILCRPWSGARKDFAWWSGLSEADARAGIR